MKTTKARPIVLTNGLDEFRESVVEGDCACVPGNAPVSRPQRVLHSNIRYVKNPNLSVVKLRDDWKTIYQPAFDNCFAVINDAAEKVLHHFNTPQNPNELLDHDRERNDDLQLSLERLAACQGILPEGTFHEISKTRRAGGTLTAWIHVTNACNLSCQYCYLNKSAYSMSPDTGKAAIDSVFRSATRQRFEKIKMKYAGGEPTLKFHLILDLHDYANELNSKLKSDKRFIIDGVVLTNGTRLSNLMIDELRARNLRVVISLDGIGEYHDAQRKFSNGRGSFKHVESTLDRLDESGVDTSISVTISKKNLKGLPKLVEYLLQRKLLFELNFFRDCSYTISSESLKFTDKDMITALRECLTIVESNLPSYSLLSTLLDRTRLDFPHIHSCGACINYLVIDPYGKIAKCHMEIDNTITDVSIDDPLLVLQSSGEGVQNPSVDDRIDCRDCIWRYWCGGGCPILTTNSIGQVYERSPNCQIYKALFPEIIRLEGIRLLHDEGRLVS